MTIEFCKKVAAILFCITKKKKNTLRLDFILIEQMVTATTIDSVMAVVGLSTWYSCFCLTQNSVTGRYGYRIDERVLKYPW